MKHHLLALLVTGVASGGGAETFSWRSCLEQSLDVSNSAAPMRTWEASRHFSSASAPDKVILTHLAPEIMGDIDHGFFLRVDNVPGGIEATLAEATGPGAITWIWCANPVGEVRLYIDNATTPVLAMPFRTFLDAPFLSHIFPFAAWTDEGANLHFPFCHAKAIRLAVFAPRREDLASLYYQVAWNAFPPDADVEPFSPGTVLAAKSELKALAQQFNSGFVPDPSAGQRLVIPPHTTMDILNAKQAGSITAIRFTGKSRSDFSGVRLQAEWDGTGRTAFDNTLTQLAGVSEEGEDARSLPAISEEDSLLLRWFMPFGPGSRMACTNAADHEISAEIWQLETTAPLRFHAVTAGFENVPLVEWRHLRLADMIGPGRVAGVALRVNSHGGSWWGEGDEVIYLDDFNTPAWQSTGTEDYFGFAWAARHLFDHPLRGLSRVDGRTGVWAMRRFHLVDALPFQHAARYELEAHDMFNGSADFEATVFWYGP